jgi:hypothetical protein
MILIVPAEDQKPKSIMVLEADDVFTIYEACLHLNVLNFPEMKGLLGDWELETHRRFSKKLGQYSHREG